MQQINPQYNTFILRGVYLKGVEGITEKCKKRKRLEGRLEDKRRLGKFWETGEKDREREVEEIKRKTVQNINNKKSRNYVKTRIYENKNKQEKNKTKIRKEKRKEKRKKS